VPLIETVLFDMDGVLSHYDFARRLEVLAAGTGLTATEIDERIFRSGFDARADDGAYTADQYMAEFSRLLGVPVSIALWLDARRAGMSIDLEMLALARGLAEHTTIAMLTNNGPVLRAHLPAVAPAIVETFGERAFFSCQFATGKTKPDVFGLVLAAVGGEPERTLFVDDTTDYLENARVAGLQIHHFRGIDRLRDELSALGVL